MLPTLLLASACRTQFVSTSTPTISLPQNAQSSPTLSLPTQTKSIRTQTFSPVPSQAPDLMQITVYFTDSNRYAAGNPPFEVGVNRTVSGDQLLPLAVLQEFFKGPTQPEQSQGLIAVTSGFTGVQAVNVINGAAHVYLTGSCNSQGATYTIAQPIMTNLLQFDNIQYVKIYDTQGQTEQPYGPNNSIPFCLEP